MKNRYLKRIFTGCILMTMLTTTALAEQSPQINQTTGGEGMLNKNPNLAIRVTPEQEYYTFELSENVERRHVYYKNRFGIEIAADLYVSKGTDMTKTHPAIVIGPPYGGVKEQSPGVYANQLAQRGFVVLAFDPSNNGYSGGEPRNVSSPDMFVENFSAAVDYLGTQPFVDKDKIGAIGVCGSGGFALSAAQIDTRIKAVATTSMYDISVSETPSDEERQAVLEQISQQRWVDFKNDKPEYIPAFPAEAVDTIPEGLTDVFSEFFSYYGLERGHHPNALGGFTTTSRSSWMNFSLLEHLNTISPRPILLIVGDNAHSRFFSETVFKNASEPKELYVVENSNHVDLYDDITKIPFDKLEDFFNKAFGQQ